MAPRSGGISGVAVALSGAGALLVYSGLRGVSPLDALRTIGRGTPPPKIEDKSPTPTGPGGSGSPGTPSPGPGTGTGARLLAAAMNHKDEQYSQVKRWQNGYSDCSSFVGKALKDIGIKPPGVSVVSSYLTLLGTHWRGITKISREQLAAGDLIIAMPGGHMVIAMDGWRAIGQQNSKRDVQVGPIEELMWGMMSTTTYWRVNVTPPNLGGS